MFFTKVIAYAALALVPFASAQVRLQFTSVPGPFTIGTASTITWTGGQSGESVTLILRNGTDTNHLNTVKIIASNINGTSYSWTPTSDLSPADDYALQITQGLDGNNYSGLFSIQSAAAGAATTVFAVAGSSTIAIATVTPNVTMSANATATANMTSTTTVIAGTGASGMMPHNTTMSSPTLSGSAILSATTTGPASSSSAGGAIPAASGKAVMGLGAIAAAAMYLL